VISSADLHVWKEREYLFRIVPGRRVFWYAFDTFLQNPQQKQFQQCRLEYEYATPSGGNGRGTAFAGLWNEYWFDSKPTPFFFNLPGSKDYRQQFFFEGPEQKPQWIRARAICDQPSQQVSPQYYVDLSRAVGVKGLCGLPRLSFGKPLRKTAGSFLGQRLIPWASFSRQFRRVKTTAR
jgi:hypothetical protein